MRNFDFRTFIIRNKKTIIITTITILMIAVIVMLLLNYKINRENSIFCIKEIIFYNNANITNNSSTQSLESLNICQYSDLSIYIDNNMTDSEITKANTIKELYIDNIYITSKNGIGTQTLNYKNPSNFGKYIYINPPTDNRIDFNVVNTNEENNNTNYNFPTFYTDCSNPITLGYLNNDIVKNYSISNATNIVSYNAKVLKEANVNLEDINNILSFTIHIINNSNHSFSCNVNINLPLDEDFLNSGYSYIRIPISEDEYKFSKD